MKKALVLALVLGSSSVAMADPYSFGARASFSLGTNQRVVRAPLVVRAPVVRDHRNYDVRGYDVRNEVRSDVRFNEQWNAPARPIFINGIDCQNWDPANDHLSVCASVYQPLNTYEDPRQGRWTALGSRDSSISDHQYITVQQNFRRIRIESLTGAPQITKVGISFMDGSTQVVQLGSGCHGSSTSTTFEIERGAKINQIVFYTANGSRGAYSVFAL